MFECLFIFSISKLLLNAASYDGEIWQADAWQPRPGLLWVFCVYRGRRYQKWHFQQKIPDCKQTLPALTAGRLG